MNRAQKEDFVTNLTKGIGEAQAFAVMSFNKIDVDQMTLLRLSLRKQNVRVKVLKNTLAKRALENSPYKELVAHLEGPTLLAYGPGDPVATAKAINEWVGKENFDLKIRAGAALGKVVTDVQLKSLAKLPGRKEMLVGFLWALQSPPTKFLYALQDAPRRLGYALGALKANKEKEAQN